MNDEFSVKYSKHWILLKNSELHFSIRCFCRTCKPLILNNIKILEQDVIKTGSFEEVNNQAIILNKLYGKK